jgi:hypothetical protein
MSKRLIAIALSAALTLAVIGGALPATGAAQAGKSLRGCHLSPHEQRHLGTSYVTSLRVQNTGCSTGKKVVKAFHQCRHKNGGPAGRCNHAVRKFHCSERRYNNLPHVQYDGTVTCKRGSKLIKSTYTQNY